jgi:glycosyltransferase involved in cell wall biosynthesis
MKGADIEIACEQNQGAHPPLVDARWLPGGWPKTALPECVLHGKFDRSVSLLAWGYNEEQLVEAFLERSVELLDRTTDEWEIVFVDDCSTDRTSEILRAFAAREPRLKVVRHERNLDVGMALRSAVANARNDYLFCQTVDWSYELGNLRIFLELLKHFDVVQGVRPVPVRLLSYIPILRSIYRVRRRSDSLFKALISLGNYYVLRVLFGVPFHDFQNITFYPTKLAQGLPLDGRTSFTNPEMLFKSYYQGARFIEVPIRFVPRSKGIPKGTRPSAIARSIVDTARNWLSWGLLRRLLHRAPAYQQIHRVAEPFRLDQAVLRLILPLFDDFR